MFQNIKYTKFKIFISKTKKLLALMYTLVRYMKEEYIFTVWYKAYW